MWGISVVFRIITVCILGAVAVVFAFYLLSWLLFAAMVIAMIGIAVFGVLAIIGSFGDDNDKK
jgi:hypothetical protein